MAQLAEKIMAAMKDEDDAARMYDELGFAFESVGEHKSAAILKRMADQERTHKKRLVQIDTYMRAKVSGACTPAAPHRARRPSTFRVGEQIVFEAGPFMGQKGKVIGRGGSMMTVLLESGEERLFPIGAYARKA